MPDPTTQKPRPRDGFLIADTTIELDDGKVLPAYVELAEDEFMDRYGMEAADAAMEARDAALHPVTPPAPNGATEPPQATQASPYIEMAAQAVKRLREVADAIENGAPVGAVVLAACPAVGAPVIGTCWTMAPDQYEKALGMIARLQAKMAVDERRD